jgi:hypothetical protein
MQETPEQYTQRIFGHVHGKNPLRVQRETPKKLAALIRRLNRKQLTRRPEPARWSIAEILAHLADTEIVVARRLRYILGNNSAPIARGRHSEVFLPHVVPRRRPRTSVLKRTHAGTPHLILPMSRSSSGARRSLLPVSQQ